MARLLKAAAVVVLVLGALLADRWNNLNPLQKIVYTHQLEEILDDLGAIGRYVTHDDPFLKALGIDVALPPCKYNCPNKGETAHR